MDKTIIGFIKWLYKNEIVINDSTTDEYINALLSEFYIENK